MVQRKFLPVSLFNTMTSLTAANNHIVTIKNHLHSGVRASDFVGRTTGKLRDFYRIGKILGTGAFGEVRMCVHRESGAQRAVKVLRKSYMDEDEKAMLFNEINILKGIVSALTRSFVNHGLPAGPPKHYQDVRVLRGREAFLSGH